MTRRCCASPPASSAAASTRWPPPSSPAPKRAASPWLRPATSPRRPARVCGARSRATPSPSATTACSPTDRPTWGCSPSKPRRCGATAPPPCSSSSTAGRRGCSASPTRSRRRRRRRWPHSGKWASASSCSPGDSRTTAEAVARRLGIDQVEAEVLPERKGEVVKRLQAQGHAVAMAGDGINDAPALAQADVGIAMGTGADIAMESARVTLMKGDLRGIARARRLSRAVMRNIRQNLFFAFVYNALGVPIAAGGALPRVRPAPEPDHCQRGHEPEFGLGHRQRPAPAQVGVVGPRRVRPPRPMTCINVAIGPTPSLYV